jgi:alcohol dehydrogenase class IV
MADFEFATAHRIVFGAGAIKGLADQLAGKTKRLLLVRGKSPDAIPRVREILSAQSIGFEEFEVHGEPTVDTVSRGAVRARGQGCDMIVGLGGGSVLDAGKAIAALTANPGDIFDYLEIVGRGKPLENPPLPYIAIPTTAGTGTEVTRNAVLESPAHGVKVSLRSPLMLPVIALVDPELTYSLPPAITASSGLDALTQLIEPFVSVKANPVTDAVCREGIRHAATSLRQAYFHGTDASAREGMSLASLLGGMALANAGLGAVHGFAGPLGGMLHAPHGAICARLLPLVMEANLGVLESRHAGHPALGRYTEIARIVCGDTNASAQDGVNWIADLVHELKIPPLSMLGMSESQIPEAVEKTLKASSFKGNPIPLTGAELREILEKAI